MGLFKRASIFTDIHFGLRNDSEEHNQDCVEFIDWFIAKTIEYKCDTIIFMGDWFHNRVRTEVRTAYYSKLAIELLDSIGLPVYWLLGNHDIYFKNDREIHSLPYLNNYRNINIIDKVSQIDDVTFSPWLFGEDYKILLSTRPKYIFGHFELPFFLMNQVIEKVYDGDGLHIDDFVNCDAVYSGHFHKRQVRLNKNKIPIYYIGNCFGHDFNDANDHDRGMAILEYEKSVPEYIEWSNAPTFDRYNISDFISLMDKEDFSINPKATIELVDDMNLTSDTIDEIKQVINARNVRIRKTKNDFFEESTTECVQYETLDSRVEAKLRSMTYDGNFDPELLISLYKMI
jgi:DNA repair exonuclease SbcCD nuclease subunit